MDNLEYAARPLWESQRLNALFVAQKMCPKRLKLKDIYSLPWDHESDGEVTDMKEFLHQVGLMENILNNKGNETEEGTVQSQL